MSQVNRGELRSETTSKCALLTKGALIENVAKVAGVSWKEAAAIVERILDSIVRMLHRGDRVEICGFGTFGSRQRVLRLGCNLRTGVRVEVPAKRIPFFKPGKELRDVLGKL